MTDYYDPETRNAQLIAWAHVCNDWHRGQWSREYRIMCRALRRLNHKGFCQILSLAPKIAIVARYTALVGRMNAFRKGEYS